MVNLEAADAFYMGVNLGQAEALAQKGIWHTYIGTTIDRAQYHAGRIPQLSELMPYFNLIRSQWGLHQGPSDTVRDGHVLESNIDDLTNHLVVGLTPYVNVFYAGFRLGGSEIYAVINQPDELEWVRVNGLPEALANANSSGVWTTQVALINWAASCENTPYYQKAIEGARRLLYSDLAGRPETLTARAANVQIVIGPGQSILDPVYARSLVIDDGKTRVAIVSVDATYVYGGDYGPIRDRVLAYTPIDTLILGATHTHRNSSAPSDTIQNSIADAIIIAAGDLSVAEIGVAKGYAQESFNRIIRAGNPPSRTSTTDFNVCIHPHLRDEYFADHPLDLVNNDIDILHLRSVTDKSTIATVVNYSAHPVVLQVQSPAVAISADYPGEVEAFITRPENLGGECLFLQGAAGDVDPWCCLIPKPSDARGRMLQMAESIGGSVVVQTRAIDDYESNLPILFHQWDEPLPYWTDVNQFHRSSATLTTVLLGGNIALAGMPGEFFTTLGQYLKLKSPCINTFFIGYVNDTIAYVPSSDDWHTGGYGTTTNILNTGKQDWCGIAKGDGEMLVDAAVNSIVNLMGHLAHS